MNQPRAQREPVDTGPARSSSSSAVDLSYAVPSPVRPSTQNSLLETAGRIGAAIASGVGVLGLVTLAGGAILMARFEAAGLPSEQAVAVVPKEVMLTVGAEALVPFLVVTAASLAALELLPPTLPKQLTLPSRVPLFGGRSARLPLIGGRELTDIAAPISVLLAVAYYIYSVELAPFWLHLIGVTLASTVCVFAALHLRRFGRLAFGVTVLIGFVAVAVVIRAVDIRESPLVRPAALIRTGNDEGMTGLFVAEKSDRVYIARVQQNPKNPRQGMLSGGRARLIVIPRDEITALAVGSNQPLDTALSRGDALLDELQDCRAGGDACNDRERNAQPAGSTRR